MAKHKEPQAFAQVKQALGLPFEIEFFRGEQFDLRTQRKRKRQQPLYVSESDGDPVGSAAVAATITDKCHERGSGFGLARHVSVEEVEEVVVGWVIVGEELVVSDVWHAPVEFSEWFQEQ